MKKQKRLFTMFIILASLVGIYLSSTYLFKTTKQSAPENVDDSQNATEENTDAPSPSTDTKALMAYVQDFRNPNELDYANLSHIIFSFAHPTTDGNILFNGDTALNNLKNIVIKANGTNTKVMLAVGGWSHLNGGESYDYFRTAISRPSTRTHLVNTLIQFVDENGLDGIDIDFEHPRSTEDASYLNLFIQELSNQLQPMEKELSVAVHSKINAYTGEESNFVYYETSMFQYVDHVNIMAYDGQWDEGYHAENLSTYTFTKYVVNYWSKLFDENNLSKEKLILGVPLYAQPEDSSVQPISYTTIINANPDYAVKDTVSMNGTTYYYNGIETMKKKANLVLDYGFGGMMMWEAGYDSSDQYSITSILHNELEKTKN